MNCVCKLDTLISFLFSTMTPTNAQLFHKLSHPSYMFRHYCVIFREFVVSTLPSYTSMSSNTNLVILPTTAFDILVSLGKVLTGSSLRITQ
jgi:hypothetical protein